MIDTIRGYLLITDKSYSDIEHLFGKENKTYNEEKYTRSFHFSNIKFYIDFDLNDKPYKLRFYGSLTKFYFGNNLAQLDWDSTKDAIQMLSDNLNINLFEANLTRIDFGINLVVNKPVHHYTSCLVSFPRLKWNRYWNSITFSSKSSTKALIIYDKINELKNNDKTAYKSTHEFYRNLNVIRYEIRLIKNLNSMLGMKKITMNDLLNDTVQKKLAHLLLDGYEKIQKMSIGEDPLYLLNEQNGLFKYLSYHGAVKLGHDRILNNISDLEFDVKNPTVKRSKMKSSLNGLLKDVKENTLEENLVTEMDDKIRFIQKLI